MKRGMSCKRGQMAVVMTFAIATLLGAMVLGVLYFNWMQLQTGADAAALAWRGEYGSQTPPVSKCQWSAASSGGAERGM